jgi:hypothetical protein
VRAVDWIEAKQMGWRIDDACLAIRFSVGCALIIPMIIQTILLDPSRAVWSDSASNVSRLDPSEADQADPEHPTRNRKHDELLRTRRVGLVGDSALPNGRRGSTASHMVVVSEWLGWLDCGTQGRPRGR